MENSKLEEIILLQTDIIERLVKKQADYTPIPTPEINELKDLLKELKNLVKTL